MGGIYHHRATGCVKAACATDAGVTQQDSDVISGVEPALALGDDAPEVVNYSFGTVPQLATADVSTIGTSTSGLPLIGSTPKGARDLSSAILRRISRCGSLTAIRQRLWETATRATRCAFSPARNRLAC